MISSHHVIATLLIFIWHSAALALGETAGPSVQRSTQNASTCEGEMRENQCDVFLAKLSAEERKQKQRSCSREQAEENWKYLRRPFSCALGATDFAIDTLMLPVDMAIGAGQAMSNIPAVIAGAAACGTSQEMKRALIEPISFSLSNESLEKMLESTDCGELRLRVSRKIQSLNSEIGRKLSAAGLDHSTLTDEELNYLVMQHAKEDFKESMIDALEREETKKYYCYNGDSLVRLYCERALTALTAAKVAQSAVRATVNSIKMAGKTKTVEFLYFPHKQHVEILVGDKLYAGNNRWRITEGDNLLKGLAARPSIGHSIQVTEKEWDKMRKFMSDKEFVSGNKLSCVGSMCKLLKENTSFRIPFPFNRSPALASTYLEALRTVGASRRVTGIVFRGNVDKFALRQKIKEEYSSYGSRRGTGNIYADGAIAAAVATGIAAGGRAIYQFQFADGTTQDVELPISASPGAN